MLKRTLVCFLSALTLTQTGKTKIRVKHTLQKSKQEQKSAMSAEKSLSQTSSLKEGDEKFIKNLSKSVLSDAEIKLLSKGLKFIPTPVVTKINTRRQLLRDFKHFARRSK